MGDKCLSAHSTAEAVTKEVRIDVHRVRSLNSLAVEEEKSVMSLPPPIYIIYGLFYTAFGPSVCPTQARPTGVEPRPVGITGAPFLKAQPVAAFT
jgi:hypothetical protein